WKTIPDRLDINGRASRGINDAAIDHNIAFLNQRSQPCTRSRLGAFYDYARFVHVQNANQALWPVGVSGALRRSGSPKDGSTF
ncbi:hypothetical protein, partial [Bradyrhizobium sp. 143]|uniref:hypothetical protein n=1 Tax=Bradyrhizobium sp. 143 TaxID=2782619 RepID=UPI001FF761F3